MEKLRKLIYKIGKCQNCNSNTVYINLWLGLVYCVNVILFLLYSIFVEIRVNVRKIYVSSGSRIAKWWKGRGVYSFKEGMQG